MKHPPDPSAVAAALAASLVVGITAVWSADHADRPHATIGATEVPTDLHCQEDEAIALTPKGVLCIHLESIRPYPRQG